MDGFLAVHEELPVRRPSRLHLILMECMLHAVTPHATGRRFAFVPRTARVAVAYARLECPADMHLAEPRWHVVIARARAIVQLCISSVCTSLLRSRYVRGRHARSTCARRYRFEGSWLLNSSYG